MASDQPVGDTAGENQESPQLCQFFLMGKCHFGKRCRLVHSQADKATVSCDQEEAVEDDNKEGQQGNRKTNEEEHHGHRGHQGMNKKSRMRTADDVISRIQWDPTVDASEFMVGYLDRFLGVMERPFCDFSWDTSPCDWDCSAELALPRHRIQYFTYRGRRVWDRNTRTDRVFGSTGQSLAPPFGEEEEVKEFQEPEEGRHLPPVSGTEERLPPWEGPHSAEAKIDEINFDSTEQEPAANREETLPTQVQVEDKETLAGCQESCDGEDDDGEDASAPLTTLNLAGRPPKTKPTHFISFRANTPAVLSCFQQLQEEITALLPSSAPHWTSASSLHVTLCLLVLRGSAEVATAMQILQQFAYWDRSPPVTLTFPVKLKHFNGKVLFLSPQPQLQLRQLNSGLQEAFRSQGMLHRASFSPRYHLTLAKVKDKEGPRLFEGVGHMKVGKGLNFGRLPVNTLHLCVVGSPRVDGFYQSVYTVTLR